MIDPNKLFQLEAGQKRRKLALSFGALERDIAGIAERGASYDFSAVMPRAEYTKRLAEIVLKDPKLPDDTKLALSSLLQKMPFDEDTERRVCNMARNALLGILGTFPAEWDLVIAPHKKYTSDAPAPTLENSSDAISTAIIDARDFYEGMMIYAEDIRSPFNLGSIFRTAEAMGVDKMFISPLCTSPEHPRAVRSAMGCIETMGWTRCALDELPADIPVFALETGGTSINEFEFPQKGVCIIGSEELGCSPEALHRATYGCVSIPMKGLKASLNVGVAVGILLQKWVESFIKLCYN